MLLFTLTLVSLQMVQARNLDNRWGFGVSLQDFNSLAALSLRRHFSPHISVSFLLGFDTLDSKSASLIGAKLMKNIYLEENLNLFLGMGAYLISNKDSTTSGSSESGVSNGFEFDGLLGAEFFLSGLPNLGLMFETGFAVRSVRTVSFKTIGSGFAGAAIHFYF